MIVQKRLSNSHSDFGKDHDFSRDIYFINTYRGLVFNGRLNF